MKTANGYSNKPASDHAESCDAVLASTSKSGSHAREVSPSQLHGHSSRKVTRASGSATFQILDGRGNFDERSVRKSSCRATHSSKQSTAILLWHQTRMLTRQPERLSCLSTRTGASNHSSTGSSPSFSLLSMTSKLDISNVVEL